MKVYIGTKVIQAVPMDEATFNQTVKTMPGYVPQTKVVPGYKVVYPEGYVSWSPQGVFETAYREITAGERALLSG